MHRVTSLAWWTPNRLLYFLWNQSGSYASTIGAFEASWNCVASWKYCFYCGGKVWRSTATACPGSMFLSSADTFPTRPPSLADNLADCRLLYKRYFSTYSSSHSCCFAEWLLQFTRVLVTACQKESYGVSKNLEKQNIYNWISKSVMKTIHLTCLS